MDCSVCCEKINATIRKSVQCNFCEFSACRKCVKTYMFSSINHPHCMSCKHPWTFEKIAEDFTKTFWNGEFRDHQANMLLESEKALLPETQREIYEESQHKLYNLLSKALTESKEVGQLQMASKLDALLQPIREELGVGLLQSTGRTTQKKVTQYQALCNCPNGDCRGFIQISNYKCGMCDTQLCKKCQVAKNPDEEHTCKQEDIDTAKLLRKDTKACPGCNTLIFKIDGCDQMWCVVCKKAFSWKTGEFQNKIHNPHYYQWMRANGREPDREPGDIPCPQNERELRPVHQLDRMTALNSRQHVLMTYRNLHRAIMHNQLWVRESIEGRNPGNEGVIRRNMRISYLKKEITEESWKRELVLRERKRERTQVILNILDLFVVTTRDLINSFTEISTISDFERGLDEVNNLVIYCNDCLLKIAKLYNTVPFHINEKFMMLRV